MAILKQKNGNYKVEVFYPKKYREIVQITTRKVTKTLKTKEMAKSTEREIQRKIEKVIEQKNARSLEILGDISFEEFYHTIFCLFIEHLKNVSI